MIASLEFTTHTKKRILLYSQHTIDRFVSVSVSRLLVAVLTIIGTAVILLWMHWQLALFILFLNPVVIYFTMVLGKQVKKLPMTLGDALKELENDDVIRSAMPGEMYKVYHHYKNDEWERFNHSVSNWDLENYLDCLP